MYSKSNWLSISFQICPQAADFYIGHDHPIYKRAPWTQQSLGCGQPGDFIYIPASFIWSSHHQARKSIQEEGSNATTEETTRNLQCGDEIRDRWLQYRLGLMLPNLAFSAILNYQRFDWNKIYNHFCKLMP